MGWKVALRILHRGPVRWKWAEQGSDGSGTRRAPGQVCGEHTSSCVEAALPSSGVHSHLTLCPHTATRHWHPPVPTRAWSPRAPVNYCDQHSSLLRAVSRDTGMDRRPPGGSLGKSLSCSLVGGAELDDTRALPARKGYDSKFPKNTVTFKGQMPRRALLSLGTSPRS